MSAPHPAVELTVCPRCSARPRVMCVTSSGARATFPHAARLRPYEAGWRVGYGDGLRDALDAAEREVVRNGSMATAEHVAEVIRRRL